MIGEVDMPIVMSGDFNLTLNQNKDNFNYKRENNTKSKEAVKNMMSDNGLIDIYRERNPEVRRYTWRVGNPVVKQARLDMFLISGCLEGYVEKTEIHPGYRSDHSMITLHLDITKQPRGRGLFKFNVSLLKDPNYIKLVKNTIQTTVCEYAVPIYRDDYVKENLTSVEFTISSSLFFEMLMLTLRRETVTFGIKKSKEERKQEKQLENIIGELENKVNEIGSREINDQLEGKKKALERLREKKIIGSIVRSRAIWRENSEKPSKYFLTLEKRRYESKRISCIKTAEGIKRNQTDILKTFEDFFQRRFSQQNHNTIEEDCKRYLSEIALTGVNDSDRNKLEESVTLTELGSTLSKMKNGTSPGSDGFAVEFYKFFWSDIKEFFQAMCNESFSRGTLPQTLREGIIVLLPKPNKPRDLLKSYRPITLLNVCYKIISGTIANRLKVVLQNIIDTYQTAYLKGRFMGDNIRMIYDVIQQMKQEQTSGILLSLDIEAAFDSVSWSFIRKVMEVRNFPPNIIRWFNTLYIGSFARVLYNGHLSGMIKLARSCRQGDALSCYLFILVMDVLAKRINCNIDIKGIKMANQEQKTLMYADDTVCLLEPNERCITQLFQELGWFAKFSGLSPNLEKTQAMWIGASFKDAEIFQSNVNLQWCEAIKILGITFQNNLSGITDIYRDKVNEIKREISKWMIRNISLPGKVTIIKSLLVSKISYLFMAIPNPSQEIVKELTTALFKFMWHGKGEKIKRSTLIKEPLKGGVGMLDLTSYMRALKITWIRRYITKQGIWKAIAGEITGQNVEFWRMGPTGLRRKVANITNVFWREVLSALADFKEAYELDTHQISASPIFFSEVTKFKSTWVKKWYDKGIRTLNDLLKPDGTLMEYEEFKRIHNIHVTFLDYGSLLKSLPLDWRQSVERRKLDEPIMDPVITYIVTKDTGSSHLSRIFVELKTKQLEKIWEKAWESRLNEVNWKDIYACLRNTPVQYRAIRYKIISRIVGTNSLLERMQIKTTDACDYCMQRENIEHKFWNCRSVARFWNEIKEWLVGKQLRTLVNNITINEIILGGGDSLIINHVVSVGVYMIYSKKHLSVTLLIALLKADLKSEQYCAKVNDKEEIVYNKWNKLNFLRETDLI